MTTEKDCIAIQFRAACVTGRTAVSRHGAERWARRRGVHGARRWQLGAAGAGRAGALQSRCRRAGPAGGRSAGRAQQDAAAGAGVRGARGAGLAGRQARGLALGCALGALGLFSIRFDSVSKFFEKKN